MDYEKEAVAYLKGEMAVDVYHTAPEKKPGEFLTVRLSSVIAGNRVQTSPTLIVKCWSKTRPGAAALASQALDAVFRSVEELPFVFDARIVGDYREPEPPKGYEQRVITFQWGVNI